MYSIDIIKSCINLYLNLKMKILFVNKELILLNLLLIFILTHYTNGFINIINMIHILLILVYLKLVLNITILKLQMILRLLLLNLLI